MRHRNAFRRLGRNTEHRDALLRNLATSLLLHEQIRTTLPKAKELRPYVEKLITKAREDTLHRKRQASGVLYREDVVRKLFEDVGPRYLQRPGGYTRIIKAGFRHGDNAPMAIIELVDRDDRAKGASSYKAPGVYAYGSKEDDPDDL